jgi:hypothetical protein
MFSRTLYICIAKRLKGRTLVNVSCSKRTEILLTRTRRLRLEKVAKERQISVGSLISEAIDAYTAVRSRPSQGGPAYLLELGAIVDEWPAMKGGILRGLRTE